VSRARLFYDIGRKEVGLISRYDYVALDEIQTIVFPRPRKSKVRLRDIWKMGSTGLAIIEVLAGWFYTTWEHTPDEDG